LSHNRRIQYLFMAAPRHVWIIPPQATTTELSSYGVRTVDVVADDDLFVPGFEYHFLDDTRDPPVLYSQIPAGWAGAGSPVDEARADASAWCDALPVVQAFRRQVLGRVPASRRRACPGTADRIVPAATPRDAPGRDLGSGAHAVRLRRPARPLRADLREARRVPRRARTRVRPAPPGHGADRGGGHDHGQRH